MLNIIKKTVLSRRVMFVLLILLSVLLIVSSWRIWVFLQLRQTTRLNAIRTVTTIEVKSAPTVERLTLPGRLQAWHQTPIYARTNGYIKQWYVDIGDRVKKGDLLAEIETPELNAQLRQAEADLQAIMAQSDLADLTATRWRHLLESDSVSKQDAENKFYAAKSLAARIVAQRAKRDRLRELVAFERIIAPFSGVISERGIDIGDLITAGDTAQSKPLFQIVQTDKLRLYVSIPELYSTRIRSKMTVQLRFAEHLGQTFDAYLLNTAHALNPKTQTLLAEFIVDNHHHHLLPGSYSETTFLIPSAAHHLIIPVNALLFRAEGLQLALVDEHHRVTLRRVLVYRDEGTRVDIQMIFKASERVILNPPDSISEGELVRVIADATRDSFSGDKKLKS